MPSVTLKTAPVGGNAGGSRWIQDLDRKVAGANVPCETWWAWNTMLLSRWVNTPVGRFPDLTWCGTDLGTADKCYLFLINVLFYQNVLLLLLFVSTPWVSLLIVKEGHLQHKKKKRFRSVLIKRTTALHTDKEVKSESMCWASQQIVDHSNLLTCKVEADGFQMGQIIGLSPKWAPNIWKSQFDLFFFATTSCC